MPISVTGPRSSGPPTALVSTRSSRSSCSIQNLHTSGPYSIAFGNIAGWLPLTAITPDRFNELADELQSQNHASYLPADTHKSVAKGYAAQMRGLVPAMRSKDTIWSRYYVNATTGASRPILNQPFSRGSVNINTADPFGARPVVDYRALTNPVEGKVLVEMIKWYRRYHFETSLKELGPVESAPGADVQTDEELTAWLAEGFSPSDYHPAGTAAMMPLELGGVVDQTLRVYKVKGLRVIDASVMPVLPGANTCQPTYALAEKVSLQIQIRNRLHTKLLLLGCGHYQVKGEISLKLLLGYFVPLQDIFLEVNERSQNSLLL